MLRTIIILLAIGTTTLHLGCAVRFHAEDQDRSGDATLKSSTSESTPGTGLYYYIANSGSATVSAVQIDPATGLPSLIGNYSTVSSPKSVAVSHNKKFLYVASASNGEIDIFEISDFDGQLTHKSMIDVGFFAQDILMHPSKNYLYTLESETIEGVKVWMVDTGTGALTLKQALVTSGQNGGYTLMFSNESDDPKHLFVSNYGSNATSVYEVDKTGGASDGELTHRENEISAANPVDMVMFTDTGSNVHIYQTAFDDAAVYGVSDAVSTLTFLDDGMTWINTWSPFVDVAIVEETPHSIFYDSANERLLVANFDTDQISQLAVNQADGTLSEPVAPYLMPGGNVSSPQRQPGDVIVYGNFMYVAEFGSNSLTILNNTSPITPVSGATISVGTDPFEGVIVDFN